MTDNPFVDKNKKPTDSELAELLGRSKKYWDNLHTQLKEEFGEARPEWKFYSPKFGWTHRLVCKKRTIVWMGPRSKCFTIAFVFGDKAVAAAMKSKLSAEMKSEIKNAKKYAEGRPVRLEVRVKKDFELVMELAKIKMAN